MNVNSKDRNDTALVIKAVENDCPSISSLFILGKCDLDCYSTEGKSLLELCIQKKWYLHVTYILGNNYKRLYDEEEYFHKMCHIAVEVNSSLIFDKLVKNFFATIIQRNWRRYSQNATKIKIIKQR